MPHVLETKLGEVRRRARRLVAIYGLAWVVASVLAVAAGLATVDYWLNFQDRGLRLMSSLAVAGTLLWSAYGYLYLPLSRRWSLVEVARRVERRFPQLTDRLSSSVEFMQQSAADALAGSAELRRAVVVATATDAAGLDFRDALQRRPTRRALAVAGAVAALVALLAALDPLRAEVALARLLRPLGSDAWPQVNALEFRDPPTRLAVGQDFEAELVDRHGALPDDARLFLRFDDGEVSQPEALRRVGDRLLVRRESVSRSFDYRAEGGDDLSMPWQRLEVVEPPRVESLSILLHPPAYTRWPVERSERDLRALKGTVVELSGTSTKPLARAALHTDTIEPVPLELTDGGYGFALPVRPDAPAFTVDQSGSYWIELVDQGGLVGGGQERWEIRAIADAPPSVQWEQPNADLAVTPSASVPLRAVAKDDLALRDVALVYERSDRTDEQQTVVPWWRAADRDEPVPPPAAKGGESQVVEQRWELAPLQLAAGSHVLFRTAASDYLPQTGTSAARKLSIITPAELAERLAQRQSLIVAELARGLKLQRDARQQVAALEIQGHTAGRLSKADVDQTQAAALNQRQVRRLLAGAADGLPAQVASLVADLENNRVDSPETARVMQQISNELARLETEHFVPIERDLTAAVKQAQVAADSRPDGPPELARFTEPLAGAGRGQDQVIESLESLLGQLQQWDSYRRFARDVGQLRHEQEELARTTQRVGGETLGKAPADLLPQEKANLEKIAGGQADLARRMEKVEQQIDAAQERLAPDDPLAAATLADALHQAREAGIAGWLRRAGEQAGQNQIGQAGASQQAALERLAEMADILANRREQELGRLVKKLREAEEQLANLARQEAGLKSKLAEAANEQDAAAAQQQLERLAKQQRELADATARLARQLERLQSTRGSRAAARAAGSMQQSASAGQRGDAEQAGQEAQAAEQDLAQAAQEVAQQRRQAEADLAAEQLARLEDTLGGLVDRQQRIAADTQRLEELRARQGQLSRSQVISVRQAGREQSDLGGETKGVGEKLAGAAVFRLALESAAADMARAAAALDRLDPGPATVRDQQSALRRLGHLIAALKPAPPDSQQAPSNNGGGSGGGNQNAQDAIKLLAELKLLRLLQADLQARYQTARAAPGDARRAELADLAAEQGRLADLLGQLAEPPAEQPQDDPTALPGEASDSGNPPPDGEQSARPLPRETQS